MRAFFTYISKHPGAIFVGGWAATKGLDAVYEQSKKLSKPDKDMDEQVRISKLKVQIAENEKQISDQEKLLKDQKVWIDQNWEQMERQRIELDRLRKETKY